MDILLTGGTGTIGRPLCAALHGAGHRLTVLSRRPAAEVQRRCGASVEVWSSLDAWSAERVFEAVINLAGEPIADARWTSGRQRLLRSSRIGLTETLVSRMAAAQTAPKVLLSGSAVGWYGDRGDTTLDEHAQGGNDFAARLCADWEASAQKACEFGVRVCLLRTGLVLSRQGGMLARMYWPFRLGFGTRLGDGRQWMSWIHLDDWIACALRLLSDGEAQGAFNLTAPVPVTNAEFTRALAQSLRRPAYLSMPAAALRLGLGDAASLMLGGQRVLPQRLESSGYRFQFPRLEGALRSLMR